MVISGLWIRSFDFQFKSFSTGNTHKHTHTSIIKLYKTYASILFFIFKKILIFVGRKLSSTLMRRAQHNKRTLKKPHVSCYFVTVVIENKGM